MMIDTLIPAQEKQLKVTADKWIKIGLSTQPANRAEAEKGVNLAYQLAGLAKPKTIIWSDSPRAMVKGRAAIREEVGISLRKHFPVPVADLSIDTVDPSLCAEISGATHDVIHKAVRIPVWNTVCNAVWTSAKAAVRESLYGQHDVDDLAFFDFLHTALKQEKETKHMRGLWMIAQNAGWWMPHKDTCFISERTSIVKFNKHKGLHNTHGPAIQYPDGFSIYFWHNIKIPDWFIENPKRLTPQRAITWKDSEQSKAACEIIGWHVILDQLNATIIDQKNPKEIGTLIEVHLPNGQKKRFLNVIYDTGHKSFLPVPLETKTAQEAQDLMWE